MSECAALNPKKVCSRDNQFLNSTHSNFIVPHHFVTFPALH